MEDDGGEHADLRRAMFVPISKIPKSPPKQTTFLSHAECKLNQLKPSKRSKATEAAGRVAQQIEENVIESGRKGWMTRSKLDHSTKGYGAAQVKKTKRNRPQPPLYGWVEVGTDPILGFPTSKWLPVPRTPEPSTSASVTLPSSEPPWANPDSPFKLHHDTRSSYQRTRLGQSSSANRPPSAKSAASSTVPAFRRPSKDSTSSSPSTGPSFYRDASGSRLSGHVQQQRRRPTLAGVFSPPEVPASSRRGEVSEKRRPTSTGVSSSPAVPVSTVQDDTSKVHTPQPPSRRRPTLPGGPSTPVVPVSTGKAESPEAPKSDPKPSRQTNLAEMVSMFPMPPETPSSILGPTGREGVPEKLTSENKPRRRPSLKDIVTGASVPLSTPAALASPSTPNTPTVPKLHKRPTLMDIVHQIEQERAEVASHLETPVQPPRSGSNGSDISSIIESYLTTPTVSTGNAFSPTGYWAAEGHRFEAKPEDLERYENRRLRNSISSDSSRDSTKPGNDEHVEEPRVSVESKTSSEPPDSVESRSTSEPPDSVESRSKSVSFELEPGPESTRLSIESFPSSGDNPFSTVDLLQSFGVKPGRILGTAHPFPQFDLPDDTDIREAYHQVRDTLVAYWSSKQPPRDKTPRNESGSRNMSLIEALQESRIDPSERPRLKSKTSRFRLLSRKSTKDSTEDWDIGPPEPVTKISSLPKQLMSKKMTKQPHVLEPSTTGSTSANVIEVTRVVLWLMGEEFSKTDYPTFSTYVLRRPGEFYADIETLDEVETRATKRYTIRSIDELKRPSSFVFLKDPEKSNDLKYLHDPTKHEFETILDQQRINFTMTQFRQKNKVLRVPGAGLRLLWAARFAQWAIENHEQTKEEHEKAQRASELKELYQATGLGGSVNSDAVKSESSDESVPDYAKILTDMQGKHSNEACEYLDSSSPLASIPSSPVMGDESPEDARNRRRKTTFNMGWMSAESPPPEVAIAALKLRDMEAEIMSWEGEMDETEAKIKQRQDEEKERRQENIWGKRAIRDDHKDEDELF